MPTDALVLLLAAGAIAGIVSGLFGVGGGVVMVPVLRLLAVRLGWPPDDAMHFAVATSVAAVVPTSLLSARSHAGHGNIDGGIIRVWAPAIMIASGLAGAVAGYVSAQGLTIIFAMLAALVGLRMALGSNDWRLRDSLPGRWPQRIIAAAIGWFSAWMGIGGGTLGVPALSALGVPIHRAVGTASALGIAVSVPALIGWIYAGWGRPAPAGPAIGYVQLLPLAGMIVPMLLLAPWGARIARRLPAAALRRIFGTFLLFVSVALFLRAH